MFKLEQACSLLVLCALATGAYPHRAIASPNATISATTAANAATRVAFAGFAYAGNANTLDTRFKFSRRYEQHLTNKHTDINASLRQTLTGRTYPFELNLTDNADSKGDEALVTALMITGETIS